MNIQKIQLFCLCTLIWNACSVLSGQHLKFVAQDEVEVTTANTSAANNCTTATPGNKSGWQGYVGAVIAVILFGSNFVPVKKFETGDGMFFQWVFCSAVWIAGLITHCVLPCSHFYPLAMLGGFLWATGNICVVPVIKTIGLGLGLLIWGSFNLLSGWASGRFGWFGLKPETPPNLLFNDLAIVFAMLSAICWMFVKSQPNEPISLENDDDDDEAPLLSDVSGAAKSNNDEGMVYTCVRHHVGDTDVASPSVKVQPDIPWELRLSTIQRRVIGIVLSVFSGLLYGLAFTPVIYIKDNYNNVSPHDIDYVFGHFCGIFATSTLYFIIYCAIKKNRPKVYPRVVLPAVVSGGMWAVADIGWFVANSYLSEAVSFPIVTTGPGIVASLWGVFVFKEVKGHRNYVIMAFAYILTIAGAVLAGFSKS